MSYNKYEVRITISGKRQSDNPMESFYICDNEQIHLSNEFGIKSNKQLTPSEIADKLKVIIANVKQEFMEV